MAKYPKGMKVRRGKSPAQIVRVDAEKRRHELEKDTVERVRQAGQPVMEWLRGLSGHGEE
ncbi:MAG: hypothetical protein KC415_22955 [Anaerolineales bacterium]|nr:hypothetical protein [Anaerolineales bacterium]MCB8991828.1 hypothetical protein [Ardenticatenaceae bacterium]